MKQRDQNILVIGYGNSLRGDDGAGVAVVERLRAMGLPGVGLHTCQQLTPELAETISGFERVFFVDASVELAAGEVRWQEAVAAQAAPSSLGHQMSPAVLLAWCRSLYGPRKPPVATVIGIGAGNLAVGEGLSAAVGRVVQEVARELARRLQGTAQPQGHGRA